MVRRQGGWNKLAVNSRIDLARDEYALQVVVIGAGAAGLVCARELLRAGHDVTVYEQAPLIGGVWAYDADTEDDPLGQKPSRRVFSSLYDSLRTNIPKDLMAFSDFTFDTRGGGADEWPQYPHHSKVRIYLENFAKAFDLLPLIRFNKEVTALGPAAGGGWQLRANADAPALFDAVAVCNGHYSAPRVVPIEGMAQFSGRLLHSHNYRNAEEFRGKRIALLGTAASGVDLSLEIAKVADAVYWCGGLFKEVGESSGSLHRYPSPIRFCGPDRLEFPDDVVVEGLDAFIFCTGYEYQFPFLAEGIVSVTDNWVHPLYLDLLSPAHPTLAFIGLPFMVIPFPLFEMQSKWFARVLSGEVQLPGEDAMRHSTEARIRELERQGIPMHQYHRLGDEQFAYTNLLAAQCGADPVPDWFLQLAKASGESRAAYPASFRDRPLTPI